MRTHTIVSFTLLAMVIAAAVIMLLYFPVALVWTTYEDLYGEWAQFYLFAVTGLFAARLAFTRIPHRAFFGLLAIACIYVVGEEISWGQRLLGFDSPVFFKQNNLQHEANVHNFFVGPYNTLLKDIMEYILASALVLYGAIYPLTLRLGWRFAAWVEGRLRLAAPPLYLAPFFATAALLELGLFHFNEAEFAEILVGLALAIMTAHYWFAHRHQLSIHRPPAWETRHANRFALIIFAVVVVVAGLAYSTTSALLASPSQRARIEGRVRNGYEKFAGRYERRDRWDVAAKLYRMVNEKEPGRTFILRRIANDYKHLGNNALFWEYNGKALSLALQRYAQNPDKISSSLTLARTYGQRGDDEKEHEFAARAHELALKNAQQNPKSAHDAYWLGKTAAEIEDYPLALEQYRKAFELRPSSSRYRKAYYLMKGRVKK